MLFAQWQGLCEAFVPIFSDKSELNYEEIYMLSYGVDGTRNKISGNGGEGRPKAELSGTEKLKNRWVGWNHHQGMSLAFVMLHRLICNFKYFPIYSLF